MRTRWPAVPWRGPVAVQYGARSRSEVTCGGSEALRQLMTLQILSLPLHSPVIQEPSCSSLLLTLLQSSSAQTVYFGARRLSVFVVSASRGRDKVLLFHRDIPLGPSCGQGYKKPTVLLVIVLSNLHKTINTSRREISSALISAVLCCEFPCHSAVLPGSALPISRSPLLPIPSLSGLLLKQSPPTVWYISHPSVEARHV